MARARLLDLPSGEKLMSGDSHPLVGWAQFLEYHRIRVGNPSPQARQRLREAVNKAALIYSYWRPELRYKVVDIGDEQLLKVQGAVKWLLDHQPQL